MAQTDKFFFGFPRSDLRAMAGRMGRSEAVIIHMALGRMYQQLFPEIVNYDSELGVPTLDDARFLDHSVFKCSPLGE